MAYVRPVERLTPARKAETRMVSGRVLWGVGGMEGEGRRTEDGVEGVVG